MKDNRINYEGAVVEKGTPERVHNIERLLARAETGEPITVGFLGGSITQGSVASDDTLCYAYRVYDWFKKKFPKSDVKYVNAGIGATDSEYAAARLQEHLLAHKPDFVLMEFSVNDECEDHFMETYEGAVRQILSYREDVAFMLMANVFYNDGANSERIHRRIARHYGLPMVSMRTTIYDAILRGEIGNNRDITPDDLHPNDDGHALVAGVITHYLDCVREYGYAGKPSFVEAFTEEDREEQQDWDRVSAELEYPGEGLGLPVPLTLNRYEHSIKYDNRNSEPVLMGMQGFIADNAQRTAVKDCFKEGYSTRTPGSFAEYEVEGSCIAVQYRRTINLPAPRAKVLIDGAEVILPVIEGNDPRENGDEAGSPLILDANFDETWGDKLVLTDIYMSEKKAKHTVRIEIIDDGISEYYGDFYLAGIIVSGNR